MPPKVMSGARAKVGVVDPNNGQLQVVGIYDNFSYGLQYDVSPAFILGRFTAASLDYTSVEPVNCTASGWRVVKHGAHVEGRVPNIKDLLTHEYIQIGVVDRQTLELVATIVDVRPTGYSTAFTARQLTQMTMSYMGILAGDEDTNNAEPADSTNLP